MNTMLSATRIRELSGAMLGHAESGQWDAVCSIESERRQLINDLFDTPAQDSAAELASLITDVLDSDKQVYSLGETAREAYGNQHVDVQRGRKATSAYQQHRA